MAAPVTDERISAAAARLHQGGWYFSARQLYYAVCADLELPPVRLGAGEVGLGVLLVLVGLIVAQRTALIVIGGLGVILVAIGLVTRLQERRPLPLARTLALSFTDFERLLEGRSEELPGLVADGMPATANGDGGTLVICDRADTAAVLAHNASRVGDVEVVVRSAAPSPLSGRRLVVLHDCDPAGCALVAELREQGADVVDAGINPGELSGRRAQIIEGAPARLPRDLSAHLAVEETDWLRSGMRLECATETPEQLVARVRGRLQPR